MAKADQNGEFFKIRQIARLCPSGKNVVHSIGDDTAVLSAGRGMYTLYTTDMLVEGTHFSSKDNARDIGRKALACSISDIAAMGGEPTHAVISMGVPPAISDQRWKGIYHGLRAMALTYGVSIVGGDTVRSRVLTINVALLGEVKKSDLVLRSTARLGDRICVTGRLGGSLKSKRHLTFKPRLKESRYLVKHAKLSAMMDVSDGVASDIHHITAASHLGALIVGDKIPCHKGVSLKAALHDGEDFELLFTLSSRSWNALKKQVPFAVTCIGEIMPKAHGVKICYADGTQEKLNHQGYKHFS